jgi:predicted transcriptional regulator
MTQQKQNPKIEWGFYGVTPRIVRTKYKELSHTEKWLYTCLKDLCGDKGTCFRALRTLSEETDISIGSLSTMIPHLHAVGLIHAEKKSRGRGGKEVWHISIVDIWQLNKDYCSEIEQQTDGDVQILNNTSRVVQKMNRDVQNLNEDAESCSNFERSCSNFGDRRIPMKNKDIEERTSEEESIPDEQSTQMGIADSFSADAETPTFYQELEIPVTYAEALAYLKPHGPHEGLDAVEIMKLARKLWTEAHEEDFTEAPTVKMPVVKPDQLTEASKQTPPSTPPVQADPPSCTGQQEQPEQVASGVNQHTLTAPTPPRESARQAPKWNPEAMVTKAEELRGKTYSEAARPKEINAAKKILKRKPDSTPEEFEKVFKQRNDDWWHEHCGLLNVTDLAAVPKDKNDMRYMLILDQHQFQWGKAKADRGKVSTVLSTPAMTVEEEFDRYVSGFGKRDVTYATV